MLRTKTFKFILCLAAMIFIAKPFMGFSVLGQLQHKEETNLLVKIFAKRKPEFLEEAIKASASIQDLLRVRANTFKLTMNELLLTLFSIFAVASSVPLFGELRKRCLISLSVAPIYLRDRRLTI